MQYRLENPVLLRVTKIKLWIPLQIKNREFLIPQNGAINQLLQVPTREKKFKIRECHIHSFVSFLKYNTKNKYISIKLNSSAAYLLCKWARATWVVTSVGLTGKKGVINTKHTYSNKTQNTQDENRIKINRKRKKKKMGEKGLSRDTADVTAPVSTSLILSFVSFSFIFSVFFHSLRPQ